MIQNLAEELAHLIDQWQGRIMLAAAPRLLLESSEGSSIHIDHCLDDSPEQLRFK
jgi:hypothetical protein